MGSSIALAAALAALAVQSSTQAAVQPAAGPASPVWRVARDNSGLCVLWREYGSGARKTRLTIKPSLTGDATRVFISFSGTGTGRILADATFRADELKPVVIQLIEFGSTEKERRFTVLSLPADTVRSALSASSWSLRSHRMRNHDLDLGGAAAALPTLDNCVSKAIKEYGLDPEGQSKITTKPVADMTKFFSTDDYPWGAYYFGVHGQTNVKLLIGTNGRTMDCVVVGSSGSALLDNATCEALISRAQFEPARDAEGRPRVAPADARIRWELPSR